MQKTKAKRELWPKLFPIDAVDKKTWAWKACKVEGSKNNPKITWIKNPEFKYGYLIKGY